MKQNTNIRIDALSDEIYALGDKLFACPELGFKEFKSKEIIIETLRKHGLEVSREFLETGFEIVLGNPNRPSIGLIAELDAIVTKGHPKADSKTQAAHTCGHSVQSTVMCAVLIALKESGVVEQLDGCVKAYFVPAEEYCDIAYREALVKQGKLMYLSGKENMLAQNLLDADVVLSVHVMGESPYAYSVNSTLAGFVFKRFNFIGKASHAAVIPHLGVNALNAFTLFQSAVGMLRETFVDEDKVRIHGMLIEGGESVNSIPAKVVYECYIRSVTSNTILKLSEQLDSTAKHCAAALNAKCEIETIPGYYPLIQSSALNKYVLDNVLPYANKEQILENEISMAAGDIGDVSLFKPTIQLGIGGTTGNVHGQTFAISDREKAYLQASKVVAGTVIDLLSDKKAFHTIVNEYEVKMNVEEYCTSLNKR